MRRIHSLVAVGYIALFFSGCRPATTNYTNYEEASGNARSSLNVLESLQHGKIETAKHLLVNHIVLTLELFSGLNGEGLTEEQFEDIRTLAYASLLAFEEDPELLYSTGVTDIALRSLAILLPSTRDAARLESLEYKLNSLKGSESVHDSSTRSGENE